MLKPLRIIQAVNVRWFNATAWYGLSLSRLLKDAGHEVTVLGLAGTVSFAKAEEMGLAPLACDLNTTNPLKIAYTLRQLDALLADIKPHIVNCHRGEGMLFWGLLRRRHNFSLVRTRGDQRPPKTNIFNRWLHGSIANAVIATNTRTEIKLIQGLRLNPDHVFMLPGGVDRKQFSFTATGRKSIRAQYGIKDNEIVVGLLGRFDLIKGQKECIEAVARIRAAGKAESDPLRANIRLLLAGFSSSTSSAVVEGWIQEYGLGDAAIITGKCTDVPACISAMDIGIIASQGSEAIARAAFEIMSCNVPLVATDVGVMPDLLSYSALTSRYDATGLAHLLSQVIVDTHLRETLRKEQEERIQKLTAPIFLQQTLEVYHTALISAGLSIT